MAAEERDAATCRAERTDARCVALSSSMPLRNLATCVATARTAATCTCQTGQRELLADKREQGLPCTALAYVSVLKCKETRAELRRTQHHSQWRSVHGPDALGYRVLTSCVSVCAYGRYIRQLAGGMRNARCGTVEAQPPAARYARMPHAMTTAERLMFPGAAIVTASTHLLLRHSQLCVELHLRSLEERERHADRRLQLEACGLALAAARQKVEHELLQRRERRRCPPRVLRACRTIGRRAPRAQAILAHTVDQPCVSFASVTMHSPCRGVCSRQEGRTA